MIENRHKRTSSYQGLTVFGPWFDPKTNKVAYSICSDRMCTDTFIPIPDEEKGKGAMAVAIGIMRGIRRDAKSVFFKSRWWIKRGEPGWYPDCNYH